MAIMTPITADLVAATPTDLVPAGVPIGEDWSFSVTFTNRVAAPTTVRLAVSATGTPGDDEWRLFDFPLPANGVVENTQRLAPQGYHVVVQAADAGVSVAIDGYVG